MIEWVKVGTEASASHGAEKLRCVATLSGVSVVEEGKTLNLEEQVEENGEASLMLEWAVSIADKEEGWWVGDGLVSWSHCSRCHQLIPLGDNVMGQCGRVWVPGLAEIQARGWE